MHYFSRSREEEERECERGTGKKWGDREGGKEGRGRRGKPCRIEPIVRLSGVVVGVREVVKIPQISHGPLAVVEVVVPVR